MMRNWAALGLVSLLLGAMTIVVNPALAEGLSPADQQVLKDLRQGDMQRLVIHREARPRIDEGWRDEHGNRIDLSDYTGKVVLMNLWATWCPPCLAEMPSIDHLAGAMAGQDFAVIPLSVDRFDVSRITDFYRKIDVQNLGVHQDRTGVMQRRAGALGLPVTVILDREGRELARLVGGAEWDSPEAKAILTHVIEMTAPSI